MGGDSTVEGVPEIFYEAWWEKKTGIIKHRKKFMQELAGKENYDEYTRLIEEFYDLSKWQEGIPDPYYLTPKTKKYNSLEYDEISTFEKDEGNLSPDPSQDDEENISIKNTAVENKNNLEKAIEEIGTISERFDEKISNNSENENIRTQFTPNSEELTSKKAQSLEVRETEKFTKPRTSNKTTVLLLAVLLSFIIALSFIKIGGFEILGIVLISAALGFNLVSLLWLEILSSERFKFRADLSWSFGFWSITIIPSIIATISILWSTSIPGVLDYNYQYIFTEDIGATKESYLNQILVFHIVSNILLLSSMIKTKSLSPRLIKSPWSISSLASLILFCVIIGPGNSIIYSDLLLLVFCFIIIGSSSWIYGRRDEGRYFQMSIIFLLPSSLGFYMIVEEVFSVNEEFAILSFLVLPIISNAITLLLPNKSDEINTNKKGINAVGFIILSIVLINIVLISSTTEGWNEIIPMISMLGFVSYRREHSRKIGGDFVIIHRILSRELQDNSARRKYKKANLKITLLGSSGTGKTSYCTALWTLMTTRINREIWWSKDIQIEGKHKYLKEEKNQQTLKALAEQGGSKGDIGEMLVERIAGKTCKKWIERSSFPEPSNNNSMPFSAEAFGKSEEELQRLKKKITAINPSVRGLPDPTQKGGKIEMDISFLAEVEQITPRFLLNNRESIEGRNGAITEVTLCLESWDITGESFEHAVEYTRRQLNKGIKTSELKTKYIKNEDLTEIGSPVGLNEINRAKHLFMNSPQIFYLVDVDDLVNKGDKKNVEKFLRLITKLNIGGGLGLESIKILINKADELIDVTTEDDGGIFLKSWGELMVSSKADNLVNRMTNQALDDLKATGLQVSSTFVCSFGGIVPVLDEKGEAVVNGKGEPLQQASYPMVPVNVIEPLIDLLLSENSRLYCEEN